MILKNLPRRKTRSLLTIFGIPIGIGAMVALNAIGAGLVSRETSLFTTSGADLTLTQADNVSGLARGKIAAGRGMTL